jgi:beta-glucosidase
MNDRNPWPMAIQTEIKRSDFPADFAWGVATAAYQIEGAAQEGGRGDSVWDYFCRQSGTIADGSSGLVACDHYHRMPQDVDLMASMGAENYRFSIAWPRVQPDGQGVWNEEGFAFYDRLLTALENKGIRAHLTLNHWDLPQALQEQGGWAQRSTCTHFVRYAQEVARRFGHRLASLVTHNEPWVIAILGHQDGIFAPGLKARSTAYQVAHHLLLSHGMVVDALRKTHPDLSLGIVLNLSPIYPATPAAADVAKARLDDGYIVRWYMDPLFKGTYPADVWEDLGQDAPLVQPGDMALIQRPLDFIGVNYYTRNFSSSGNPWDVKANAKRVTDMGWEVFPQGLTELLVRLQQDYQPKALLVTENGSAFVDKLVDGQVHDHERLDYLREHIAACAAALAQGVALKGYFAWSLLDNFEWASGYAKRFGLVYVDYETQQRIVKSSGHWYARFLQGR